MDSSMDPTDQPIATDDLVFRASKRRKTNRPKSDQSIPDSESSIASFAQNDDGGAAQDGTPTVPEESDQEELGLNYVIKARKQQQRRQRGGIEFNATRPAFGEQNSDGAISERPASPRDAIKGQMGEMDGRFAPQAGYKAQVDQHMMAYIDAELAKRKLSASPATANVYDQRFQAPTGGADALNSKSLEPGLTTHRPPAATAGPLQEVDIDSRTSGPSTKTTKAPRVRLGPDGKPWRSHRQRRTSEDLKRDAMVESLLSENGLNAFESVNASATPSLSMAAGTNEDADERAAAEFQRQFLEAAEERRENGGAAGQAKQKMTAVGDIAGGPKLGGSRSQRAKMHALELERERDKKAGRR